jgi:hypothetical protein
MDFSVAPPANRQPIFDSVQPFAATSLVVNPFGGPLAILDFAPEMLTQEIQAQL